MLLLDHDGRPPTRYPAQENLGINPVLQHMHPMGNYRLENRTGGQGGPAKADAKHGPSYGLSGHRLFLLKTYVHKAITDSWDAGVGSWLSGNCIILVRIGRLALGVRPFDATGDIPCPSSK